jgi:anaerobic ribonucleoside-triphosphate reductase activating protein
MRYAGIIYNDLAAAPGICVTFFTQGCNRHCLNCHNPETWDFFGGKEFSYETIADIKQALRANGIKRNLAIMGGEPLCEDNLFLTNLVIESVKKDLPDTKVYIWTGYTYEELILEEGSSSLLNNILSNTDCLIDGPYIDSERDITLHMRGSRNQRILYKG